MRLRSTVGEYAATVRTAYFRALALALDKLFDGFRVFDFEWDYIRPSLGTALRIPDFRRLDLEMRRQGPSGAWIKSRRNK
jgi:hypothetical protein